MTGSEQQREQREKEKEAAIECAMQIVSDFIEGMAGISPEEAERKTRQISNLCEVDDLLPTPFKKSALHQAKELECTANMRQCDLLLRETMSLSVEGKMQERTVMLMEARRYFARACQLGAAPDWRKAFQRADETIQMTGNHRLGDPSRAKPLERGSATSGFVKG
jgi:hypothetical protein